MSIPIFAILTFWKVLFLAFIIPINGDDMTKEVFDHFESQYLPAAFGDFNGDKLTDMFIIQKSFNGNNWVKVLLSHGISPFLRESGLECKMNKEISAVMPSDFDGDGAMDVLIASRQKDLYECYILWGNLGGLECPNNPVLKASIKTQPLLVDYNGDMITDLFGEDSFGNRTFWVFPPDRSAPTQVFIRNLLEEDGEVVPEFDPLEDAQGGHAFVDVDGDLAADLWLSAKGHFEIWPNQENFKTFEEVSYPLIKDQVPKVIGQSTFLDIDLDGDIEALLPVCADSACTQSFIYVYEFTNTSDKWCDLKVNLKDPDEITWNFSLQKPFMYTDTITLRVGDMNLDGYPDVLITLFNGNTPKVVPLINSACHTDCHYPRTFIPKWKSFDAWSNSVLGTFFDFHEDGILDVLLVNSSSDAKSYSMAVYKDSVQYDATFVKVGIMIFS